VQIAARRASPSHSDGASKQGEIAARAPVVRAAGSQNEKRPVRAVPGLLPSDSEMGPRNLRAKNRRPHPEPSWPYLIDHDSAA
jgi:hypothetical protein